MSRKLGIVAIGLLVAVMAVTAVACGDDDDGNGNGDGAASTSQITVEEAWARNAPTGGAMNGGVGGMAPTEAPGMAGIRGAAYMKITNTGHASDSLIGASSSVSAVTEIHESVMDGEQVTMQQVDEIAIPVGETVELKPGGYHVMFIDLNAPLEAGTTFQLELTFEKAGKITVDVEVRDA